MEKALEDVPLPDEDVDIPIDKFARYVLALLDIPIHDENKDKSLIESMHVLLTTFAGFRSNQHFQQEDDGNNVQSMKI